jgi:hypothetical protein
MQAGATARAQAEEASNGSSANSEGAEPWRMAGC